MSDAVRSRYWRQMHETAAVPNSHFCFGGRFDCLVMNTSSEGTITVVVSGFGIRLWVPRIDPLDIPI